MPDPNIFHVAPATVKTGVLNVAILITFVIVVAVILFVYYGISSGKNARFEVAGDQLIIHGGMYGRTIPLADLQLEKARSVNLHEIPDLRLKSRRNGLALPGLKTGWFRLQSKEKVLAFLTDPNQVAYIPTRNGFSLMLSLQEPDRFIRVLRNPEKALVSE